MRKHHRNHRVLSYEKPKPSMELGTSIGKHCLSLTAQSQGALAQKTSHYMFPIWRTPKKNNHWLIKCSVYPPKTWSNVPDFNVFPPKHLARVLISYYLAKLSHFTNLKRVAFGCFHEWVYRIKPRVSILGRSWVVQLILDDWRYPREKKKTTCKVWL